MMPIRVLIVEDSPVAREHLRRIVASDGRFEVVGLATSGEEAVEMVARLAPDVISMDIQLPGIQGFEATRQIMALHPTPIVVVSGVEKREVNLAMEAFKAGALSVVEKPVATGHEAYDAIARRLCTQLAIMSEVKVIRRRDINYRPKQDRISSTVGPSPWRLLAIAASTGGPNALLQLLSGITPDFPLPIVIVQHMTPAFLEGFARWLSDVTGFPVSLVNEPVALSPGRIFLAAGDTHLLIQSGRGLPDRGPAVRSHRPSANVLFHSAAQSFGAAVIGVLLTGMGDDGALGMRNVKTAGGFTIAEAESSAVIYGMPAAAVAAGGVCESLPLDDIAPRILELVGKRKEVA
jgi:two-component system, chemotaxis family, protein-glutamate methylesterase/glutaminase